MLEILVNAYDPRHPEHESMMEFECDTGLDIELLPNFKMMIIVSNIPDPMTSETKTSSNIRASAAIRTLLIRP